MLTQRCLRELLLAALLLATASLSTSGVAGELKPFSASYSITAGDAQIELEKLSDDRWSYRTRIRQNLLARLLASVPESMRSVFRIQNDQIIPEAFAVEDGARGDSKDQSLVFDWAAGRVRGVSERKPVDLPTQPGLLDEMSVQVALMHALINGRTPERFVMVDNDRIKEYLYVAEGRERLKSKLGEFDTVIFRSTRPESSKSTWFWCAPELGYLPLKVERRDGRNVKWSMRLEQVRR